MFQLGRFTGFGRSHRWNTPGGGGGALFDNNPHRYWRVANIEVPGGGYLEITQIVFLQAGVDVSSGPAGTVSSSSAPLASDGSGATAGAGILFNGNGGRCYWTEAVTENPNFWIMMDFGAGNEKTIDGVKQAGFDTSNRYMKTFTLQYSDDNVTWTSRGSQSNLTYPGSNTLSPEYTFAAAAPTTGRRYYRFSITANNGDGSYVSFTGIELHTAVGGGDITTTDMLCYAESGSNATGAIANNPGNTEWNTNAITQPHYTWWTVDLNTGTSPVADADVVEYVMESQRVIAGGTRTPTKWEFQVSDDNIAFYPVDIRSGESWSAPLEIHTYTI